LLYTAIGIRRFAPRGDAASVAVQTRASTLMKEPGMSEDLTADEICKLLQLEPNATCGFVRETYMSKLAIAAGGLPSPFANERPMGSALYFLVTQTAPVRLHRIRNDQLYLYYLGRPAGSPHAAR
jgi:Cupin superfamily (DUF985)